MFFIWDGSFSFEIIDNVFVRGYDIFINVGYIGGILIEICNYKYGFL